MRARITHVGIFCRRVDRHTEPPHMPSGEGSAPPSPTAEERERGRPRTALLIPSAAVLGWLQRLIMLFGYCPTHPRHLPQPNPERGGPASGCVRVGEAAAGGGQGC
eukprot:TRINITY_DN48244_c0_g1_i1.p3 TRINITY_DN48244_c0_g1~~TRINITY_DN48244_c0_g1_i1.p3  ORF type:complete len:106 (-),score=1.42 TRINITY_DN48244_c0_g1_i1:70-387(-)